MRKYIYFAYMSLQRQFMNRFDMMIVLVTTLVSFLCQYFVWKYCFRNNPEQIVYMTKYVLVSSFLFIILNRDLCVKYHKGVSFIISEKQTIFLLFILSKAFFKHALVHPFEYIP